MNSGEIPTVALLMLMAVMAAMVGATLRPERSPNVSGKTIGKELRWHYLAYANFL